MAEWNYRYAGLNIISALPLPEWAIFEQAGPPAEVDVRITLQSGRPGSISQPVDTWITPDEYCFSIPEAGDYRVARGREIIITPAAETGQAELRLFLLGTAWGALCYQRGLLALHTSVIRVNEQAIAFCGAAGAGKSSLAAGLVARGYPLIGDDLCCFDFAAGGPQVYPSAPRLKLWREALTNLGWQDDHLTRDHFRLDKFHKELAGCDAHKSVPVRALYLLEWGNLSLTRLTGLKALRRLVAAATYRPGLLEPLGRVGAYWEQCAQLARAVSIFELRRPRDWAMMTAAIDLLLQNWELPPPMIK